ncbi:hypothetical protein [Bacillus sp. JCM 19034]|uniref:hypothetical protein n=1 Tax=Bacillus sp. JCM 19034 TaxID=1481928 RepID=UPI000781B7E5|nr:hypothetical protein [Bacillus sp. JCM 19034]
MKKPEEKMMKAIVQVEGITSVPLFKQLVVQAGTEEEMSQRVGEIVYKEAKSSIDKMKQLINEETRFFGEDVIDALDVNITEICYFEMDEPFVF